MRPPYEMRVDSKAWVRFGALPKNVLHISHAILDRIYC